MKKVNLFIVGFPKSGTTTLYEWLNQHPDIFMCPDKEPSFFAKDLNQYGDYKSLNQYASLFKDVKDEKILGEASTPYIYSKVAAKEIKKYNKEAKIIIMTRNKSSFIKSYHANAIKFGQESERDLEKAIKLNKRREDYGVTYLEAMDFDRYIKNYKEVFPRSQILFIKLEDMQRNPEKTYIEVLKFINVDPSFKPDFKVYNKKEEVRSLLFRDLLILFTRLPLWFRKIIRTIIPLSFRTWIRNLNIKSQ